MYDTVYLTLNIDEVEGVDFLAEIPIYLNPDDIVLHDYGGQQVITGKLGNMKVSISPYQVKIKDGSLCKWMLGNNYQVMTRRDMQHAVERLSDSLHLPFERATVTRLDVGLSIPVKEPVGSYLAKLGALNHSKRLEVTEESLYYTLHQRAEVLCFYDKNQESKAKRRTIPELYKGLNVLRYEQRYLNRLPRLFNRPKITGALLYDETFYIDLLKRWKSTYKEIKKINQLTPNFDYMKKGIKEQNLFTLKFFIESLGGLAAYLRMIKQAQKKGDLTNKQAFNLRQRAIEAYEIKEGFIIPSEAIKELDKKIADAVRYYR